MKGKALFGDLSHPLVTSNCQSSISIQGYNNFSQFKGNQLSFSLWSCVHRFKHYQLHIDGNIDLKTIIIPNCQKLTKSLSKNIYPYLPFIQPSDQFKLAFL